MEATQTQSIKPTSGIPMTTLRVSDAMDRLSAEAGTTGLAAFTVLSRMAEATFAALTNDKSQNSELSESEKEEVKAKSEDIRARTENAKSLFDVVEIIREDVLYYYADTAEAARKITSHMAGSGKTDANEYNNEDIEAGVLALGKIVSAELTTLNPEETDINKILESFHKWFTSIDFAVKKYDVSKNIQKDGLTIKR